MTFTLQPNSRWVVKQTDAFIEQTTDRKEKPLIVMHDRDTKFTKEFVAMLKKKGIKINPLPVASPDLNGRAERFIQTIKDECLFRFILFGQWHLDHIVGQSGWPIVIEPIHTWSEDICRRSATFPKKSRSTTVTRSSSDPTWVASEIIRAEGGMIGGARAASIILGGACVESRSAGVDLRPADHTRTLSAMSAQLQLTSCTDFDR